MRGGSDTPEHPGMTEYWASVVRIHVPSSSVHNSTTTHEDSSSVSSPRTRQNELQSSAVNDYPFYEVHRSNKIPRALDFHTEQLIMHRSLMSKIPFLQEEWTDVRLGFGCMMLSRVWRMTWTGVWTSVTEELQ